MTLFLYREKPSEKHRDGKQVSSLRATTRIEGRQAFTATVRAFRASQAMGKAALNEQGCNSREVVLTAARLKPTFCNLTF